ncbi:uncharacterized protein [Hyperolius riggenbachi]|uniref:uncharacterized protein n=1 Tax=Hyperolius riggenbachi TaxID=752182 RepID=UPI0035A35CFA
MYKWQKPKKPPPPKPLPPPRPHCPPPKQPFPHPKPYGPCYPPQRYPSDYHPDFVVPTFNRYAPLEPSTPFQEAPRQLPSPRRTPHIHPSRPKRPVVRAPYHQPRPKPTPYYPPRPKPHPLPPRPRPQPLDHRTYGEGWERKTLSTKDTIYPYIMSQETSCPGPLPSAMTQAHPLLPTTTQTPSIASTTQTTAPRPSDIRRRVGKKKVQG